MTGGLPRAICDETAAGQTSITPDAGTDLPAPHPAALRRAWHGRPAGRHGPRAWCPRLLAWQFTLALGRPVAYWRSLVILNISYWYLWALFTPAIVWLSQHFRFERRGLGRALLVHIPSVALFSFGHIAAMSARPAVAGDAGGQAVRVVEEVQRSALQNFDWEMITYWAIVGLSHAVLYYRESRDRARAHGAARDEAGRSAAGGAAAAAAAPLPLQHAARDLDADAQGRGRRRPDADALERSAAADAREHRPPRDPAQGGARVPVQVPPDRTDPVRRSPDGAVRHPDGNARRSRAER